MQLRDKLAITVLLISIFVVIGGIACNYFGRGVIDLFLVILLGILIFVTIGVIMCSRGKSRIVK
ncbi:hypothetical protein EU527_18305 [Candidatus Thorarchaeota archaeon]|nr:MAG: hypothetical protein EU527_18305 [Candidatus Thorarchaeota archaeon]